MEHLEYWAPTNLAQALDFRVVSSAWWESRNAHRNSTQGLDFRAVRAVSRNAHRAVRSAWWVSKNAAKTPHHENVRLTHRQIGGMVSVSVIGVAAPDRSFIEPAR